MKKIYIISIAICIALSVFTSFDAAAQATTKTPPNAAAVGTWQVVRGSRKLEGTQYMKGNMSAAPTVKWKANLTGPKGGGEGEPVIGDVNGDGLNDIVEVEGTNLWVFQGNTGALIWKNSGYCNQASVAIGDVNNDGKIDILTLNDKAYLLNGATGAVIWSWTPPPAPNTGGTIPFSPSANICTCPNIGDLDNDGIPEAVVLVNDGVYVLNGTNGTLKWKYATGNPCGVLGFNGSTPAIGDVNGDGYLDVVANLENGTPGGSFGGSGGALTACSGNGGALLWKVPGPTSFGLGSPVPAIGDVDGDCKEDVVIGGGAVRGLTGATIWGTPTGGTEYCIIADLNNDCAVEIITTCGVKKGKDGSTIWNVSSCSSSGWFAPAPRVGDFDPASAGKEIVLASAYNINNPINMYNGFTGALLWAFNMATENHTAEGVSVADVDNDGCVEIVISPDCCNGDPTVMVLDDAPNAPGCGILASISQVDFLPGDTTACAGKPIPFRDFSSSCASNWSWSFPGGSPTTSNVKNPGGVTYTTPGTYTVTMSAVLNGCNTYTATHKMTIITCGPTVTVNPITICAGTCGNLTATGSGGTSPYTYTWNPGALTGSTVSVCPASTSTYTVTVKDNANATNTATVQVTVTPLPTPTVSGTTTICAGQSTTLTASGGGTYVWNTGASTTAITVTPPSTTSYTVTATTNGCTGSKAVTVTVNPLPVPTISGVLAICTGQSTTLTASGGGTYSWAPGGQATTAITVSPTSNTTYTVTATNNGCTGTATVQVTVAAGLSPSITGTTNICPGASTTLTANSGGTYVWNTGASTTSITVSPAVNTSYSVTVTAGTCTGTATVQVSIISPPTPTISGPTTICAGTSTTLTASGGVSYVWNTGVSTTSITVSPASNTTYTVTATNAGGCTGTATIAVTVNPNPVATISGTTTICAGLSTTLTASGGGTYAWSTGDLTASTTVSPPSTTTYTVTVTKSGCTGTATVQVNVAANLIPAITGNTSICIGTSTTLTTSGGGTYAWSDGTTNPSITVSPTTNTTYSVTVTNGTCSGSASVQVTVNPLPTPTITGNTSVCPGTSTTLTGNGGTSYVWSTGATTTSVTVAPSSATTYTVTATQNGCTGQTSVTVTITPPPAPTISGNLTICNGGSTTLTATAGGTYQWNTGAATAAITVSPTVTTTYTVIVTTGCTASATVQVTVNPIPTVTVPPATICVGTSTTLTASGASTYTWSPGTGLSGTTGGSVIANPTSTTTYVVTGTTAAGCTNSTSVTVTVNPNPAPVISGNMAICSGTSTTLTANAGGTYQWNTGAVTAAITVSPAVTTTYTVTVTTNGCTGSATAQVTVTPTPAPSIPGPITICTGQSTTLTSTTAGPYIWSTGANTSAITVTPTATTTYSVSVTVNGCTGTAAQTVTVVPPVVANITGGNICAGQSTTLKAGGNGTTYLWDNGSTTATITVSPSTTTTYTVIESVGSCADTATYTVTVNPIPTSTASGDTTITFGSSAQLHATGGGSYSWNPPAGLSCTNCADPTATPTKPTQYCVTVMSAAGCIDSSCVFVDIDMKCGFEGELYVPNGFSPNADGQNDILYVRGGGIVEMYWVIYDRWGEKVFEATNPKEGWDGTYHGKALDPGVFVYYLKVTCYSGETMSQKGNVAIIK